MTPPANHQKIDRWLLACGIIAPPFIVLAIIISAAITPGYSRISETVSQLGAQGRQYPQVMSAGFIIYGLLIVGLACGLYRQFRGLFAAKIIWLSLTLYGTGVLLSGFFQDGPPASTSSNLESTLHSAFAMAGFFSLIIAMLFFARTVHKNPDWKHFPPLTITMAVLNLGLSMLFMLPGVEPYEGLLQRCFFAISLIWIEVVSLRAYRQIRKAN